MPLDPLRRNTLWRPYVPFDQMQAGSRLYHRRYLAGFKRHCDFFEFALHVTFPEEPTVVSAASAFNSLGTLKKLQQGPRTGHRVCEQNCNRSRLWRDRQDW